MSLGIMAIVPIPIPRSALAFGHEAIDGCFHIGTVITDKDDERAFRPPNPRKRIGFVIGAGEGEIPSFPPHRMGRVHYHSPEAFARPANNEPPYPPLPQRILRGVVSYVGVVLIAAMLLQVLTPFPVLTWLGELIKMLVG